MIEVNKPYLPKKNDYEQIIKMIWDSNHLTNNGPLHQKLENDLSSYLQVNNLCLINNCTNGLLMCLNDFPASAEIITTPFSFVATTSAIIWSKLKPVFCDIDEQNYFIDVKKIEKLINKKTKAILATHIYGNTGDIESLETICKENKLKLIFDAAHAFDVKYKKRSILDFGDMSVLSFHATKVFNTVEGGAIKYNNLLDYKKGVSQKNFGFNNYKIENIGINSKMSEFHAAMGLCILPEINKIILNRKKIYELYLENLQPIINDKIETINLNKDIEWNYSYFPITLTKPNTTNKLMSFLQTQGFNTRRYFYPALNTLGFLKSQKMECAENISENILCLPLYYGLPSNEVKKISNLIIEFFS